MNDLIDKFCASKRRWLIVTAVTILIGLLTVLPLSDEYGALCEERSMLEQELADSLRVANNLPKLDQRLKEKLNELNEVESRTVDEEAVSDFRSRLIAIARDTGCRVRRISFGSTRSRQWYEDDNVMASDASAADRKKTPFAVETRPVSLSVTGSTASVRKLIGRVRSDGVMQHVKFLEMRSSGKNRQSVQLDIELWCYSLASV
ncbi:hypothetical protein Pla123a_46990 [Posidoniimonas polymericola]|uniref:General secretion pathway, M protein n=1 Tax=Posidoniimonas polymericola TaxID=2528002 RepID=A0A5C5XWD7_9BACT|nr:hypothetical protein [Posidoniimonas polymericola]TWT66305.1 hypothetical protein Pla123a_46990 [Posidoniimonas polymericola]